MKKPVVKIELYSQHITRADLSLHGELATVTERGNLIFSGTPEEMQDFIRATLPRVTFLPVELVKRDQSGEWRGSRSCVLKPALIEWCIN